MDCLDRTNVVQNVFAEKILAAQLLELGLISAEDEAAVAAAQQQARAESNVLNLSEKYLCRMTVARASAFSIMSRFFFRKCCVSVKYLFCVFSCAVMHCLRRVTQFRRMFETQFHESSFLPKCDFCASRTLSGSRRGSGRGALGQEDQSAYFRIIGTPNRNNHSTFYPHTNVKTKYLCRVSEMYCAMFVRKMLKLN
jgi:hypothetical protein